MTEKRYLKWYNKVGYGSGDIAGNVLNAHASFRTYASREEYRTGSSSLAMKLDGIWKFAYAKNYTSAIPGFKKTDGFQPADPQGRRLSWLSDQHLV